MTCVRHQLCKVYFVSLELKEYTRKDVTLWTFSSIRNKVQNQNKHQRHIVVAHNTNETSHAHDPTPSELSTPKNCTCSTKDVTNICQQIHKTVINESRERRGMTIVMICVPGLIFLSCTHCSWLRSSRATFFFI